MGAAIPEVGEANDAAAEVCRAALSTPALAELRRIDAGDCRAKHGRNVAEILQVRRALQAGSGVLFDVLDFGGVGGVQGDSSRASQELVAGQGAMIDHQRSLPQLRQIGRLTQCSSPRRMRVLICPSGSPSAVEISSWVIPLVRELERQTLLVGQARQGASDGQALLERSSTSLRITVTGRQAKLSSRSTNPSPLAWGDGWHAMALLQLAAAAAGR